MEKDKQKPETSKEAPGPSQKPTPRKTGREFTEDRRRRIQAPPEKRHGGG
jgi:hypothetical protein